ncbi:MAG: caspase family protein [Leptospiraceae bacterium]|nr:caspase family protein [Leptospiraceae bacterium]
MRWIFFGVVYFFLLFNHLEADSSVTGRRVALVVGINRYIDPSFRPLSHAGNDAQKLTDLLKRKGRFDEVLFLSDSEVRGSDLYPTRSNLMNRYESLISKLYPEDFLFFFFSGHGIGDGYGNNYLLVSDSVSSKRFSSSISVKHLLEKLQKRKIYKALFVLDACRSALSYLKAHDEIFSSKNVDPRVVAILYSTREGQYSYEDENSPHGVFTRYLLAGLEGDADVDKNLIVTLEELRKFIEIKMKDHFPSGDDRRQAPSLSIPSEFYGDLSLSFPDPNDLSSTHDPADEYRFHTGEKFLYPAMDGTASLLLPGYHDYRRGDSDVGKFLFWTGGVLGGYLYREHNSYLNLKNEYQNREQAILALPYPYDVLTYESYLGLRNRVNRQAVSVQNTGYLLVFLYFINFYRYGTDTFSSPIQNASGSTTYSIQLRLDSKIEKDSFSGNYNRNFFLGWDVSF